MCSIYLLLAYLGEVVAAQTQTTQFPRFNPWSRLFLNRILWVARLKTPREANYPNHALIG